MSLPPTEPPRPERPTAERGTRAIGACFVVSALASVGLTFVYAFGGQTQLEGALLGTSLGGLAAGLGLWTKRLLPSGPFVQERDVDRADDAARHELEDDLEEEAEGIGRRGFLVRALGAAVAALGIAALFPIRSLGRAPGGSLFATAWTPGARLVSTEDVPVTVEDVPAGGVITVFPEGHTDAADSATLLIHLLDGDLVAYSKICTHAGCPVGLYDPVANQLFCPCHQSVFDVNDDAAPVEGPATRPLPRLPIEIGDDGYLVARSDYSEPVGPGFWNRGRGPDA
ncbi:MAG TPA: Rieske 2Fe-2S domain-containing protein [Actinomycetota bacterium]